MRQKYRLPRLQWHSKKPSGCNDNFSISQLIFLIVKIIWIQWHSMEPSGYGDSFGPFSGVSLWAGKSVCNSCWLRPTARERERDQQWIVNSWLRIEAEGQRSSSMSQVTPPNERSRSVDPTTMYQKVHILIYNTCIRIPHRICGSLSTPRRSFTCT